MAAEAWARALDEYRYPVDLTRFPGADEHPSWFDLDTKPGDRLKTIDFEDRFREQAQHRLEAWGEVTFWKLYTMPLARNRMTQQVLDVRVRPDELRSACMDYIEAGSRKSFNTFRSRLFASPGVAAAATFPAFICPERFPMVDTQITRWALENHHLHCYSGVGGPDLECVPELRPGAVLQERHWTFVESWIRWCQFTAAVLTQRTGRAWRARDAKMAVFAAQKGRNPPRTRRRLREDNAVRSVGNRSVRAWARSFRLTEHSGSTSALSGVDCRVHRIP